MSSIAFGWRSCRQWLAASMMVSAASAMAVEYPTKPIRIIVPQSPGASTDLTARLVGQKLSDAFKQPVVIDNRPGAGTLHGKCS